MSSHCVPIGGPRRFSYPSPYKLRHEGVRTWDPMFLYSSIDAVGCRSYWWVPSAHEFGTPWRCPWRPIRPECTCRQPRGALPYSTHVGTSREHDVQFVEEQGG